MNKKNNKRKAKGIIKPTVPQNNLSSQQRRPIFSFHSIAKDYCISKCTPQEKASLADTLRKMSELTWAQLTIAPKHGLGYEKIRRNAIKTSIPNSVTQDVNFLAFRFHDKAPMVGYREREIFHILWLDRNFSLYNH